MARNRFPLVDVLIGIPSTGSRLGAAALLTHGIVVELFSDEACTSPLDATDLVGNPIASVTIDGITIPPFLGDPDGSTIVYGRRSGASGPGFPIVSRDAAAPPGEVDPDDPGVYVLSTGQRIPILPEGDKLPQTRIAELSGALDTLSQLYGAIPLDHWYDFAAGEFPERPSVEPNKPLRWFGPQGSHPASGSPPATNVMYRHDEGIVIPGTVIEEPPPPPPPGDPDSRFPGDPGVGNYYVGGRPDQQSFPNRATAISTWEDRMQPWAGGKEALSIDRIYDGDASVSGGLNNGPKTEIAAAYAGGRLPHVSFKLPAGVSTDDVANQTGQFATWITALADYFKSLGGKPIWWTFWHEPENDPNLWGNPDGSQPELSAKYRAACRNIKNGLDSRGVTNAVFWTTGYMVPFSFGQEFASDNGDGRRDWRIYFPDWKGTTAAGSSKHAPNPVDFRIKGQDPLAVVDGLGIDVYNWWDEEGKTKDKFVTFWDLFRHCYTRTEFLGLPYNMMEFGVMVYHTGSVDNGTAASWDYAMTRQHLSAMFDTMAQYDILAVQVFNFAIARPHWRLELADPQRARYEGYGRGMARANHVYADLTP